MKSVRRKPAAKLWSWRVSILRARAHHLGTIEAPDAKAAEALAAEQFGLEGEQRRRLVVREQGYRCLMPLPNRQQTFFENCRDLLEKLDREIDRYRSVVGGDGHVHVEELKDIAFNASVTAWHLGDWTFNDMTAEQRKKLGFKDTQALQDYARTNCRALHLCRHVATASKHWRVTQYCDPNVQTVVTYVDGWRVIFVGNNKEIAADQVFPRTPRPWC
jgi:hypothetical protein